MTARRFVGAATLVAAMLAAGCSDDDTPDATTATAAAVEDSDAASSAVSTGVLPTATTIDNQSIGPPSPDDLDLPPMPRVCTFATDVEVAGIIGQAPAAYGEAGRGGVLVCRYTDAADERLASVRVVTIDGKPSPADTFADLSAAADAEPVDGFGDQSIWAEDALHVMAGDELLTFTVFPSATLTDATAIRAATLALATLVMTRFTPPTA